MFNYYDRCITTQMGAHDVLTFYNINVRRNTVNAKL